MQNRENFIADKPVAEEKDDKFQRYSFSKGIANSIVSRKTADSIVIGLYGIWGEGKTSIINFVKEEISLYHSDIVQVTFNPWRFPDEAALLTSFFNALGNALEKSLSTGIENRKKPNWFHKRKGSLKTSGETIGEIFQEYGKLVSIFNASDTVETLGKAISNITVDTLRERIEAALEKNKKRVVIFIDDIDRLDRSEIHSIFRLIKLTADFAYTTYMLAFDEKMVSAAIGGKFGTGDQKAGANFLEKIVQVPIRIPLANKIALRNYCFDFISQALEAAQVVLSDDERTEFGNKFTLHFLNQLTTPRLAVRYGNAVTFSLSLLKGEINHVDLLLIEGIRVFYNDVYEFIRSQPDYFIGTYKGHVGINYENDKAESFKKFFTDVCNGYTPDIKSDVEGLLRHLFPVLGEVWRNVSFPRSQQNGNEPRAEKRISTLQYFNRYFSFAVEVGDISDVAFNNLLDIVRMQNIDEGLRQAKALLRTTNADNFIQRLSDREEEFDSETSIYLIKVIGKLGNELFERYDYYVFLTSFERAALFISELIRNRIVEEKRFETVEWVVLNAEPFEFACYILSNCKGDRNGGGKIFSDEGYGKLNLMAVERSELMASSQPIWSKFTFESRNLLPFWKQYRGQESLNDYVSKQLTKKPNSLYDLLRVFTPYIRSSHHPSPYFGDFAEDSFNSLKELINIDIILSAIKQMFGLIPQVDDYKALDEKQNDDNLLKQFLFWYKNDLAKK